MHKTIVSVYQADYSKDLTLFYSFALILHASQTLTTLLWHFL